LVAWSLYRRVRRTIGRQRLQPRRMGVRVAIFCVIGALLLSASLQHPALLFGYGGGLLAGAALGMVGLQLTQFETTEAGHFYTPDTRIGVGLSILLVGRLIYRFWALQNTSYTVNHAPRMGSPLTFFIVGLMLGYYVVYYVGLFLKARQSRMDSPGRG
ncbi:MAG: DUF1453 domain-containing protein, partial [Verrucomicrobia bacterium]|nr:DUF1453 domain-containing protein [Verrucomicrobiota bacterium]